MGVTSARVGQSSKWHMVDSIECILKVNYMPNVKQLQKAELYFSFTAMG